MSRSLLVLLLLVLAAPACTRRADQGNVLRVAVREKYKSLDPAHGSEYYSNVLISRAYEGLYQYHYLKRPYELEPVLAEALPRVSRDGLRYTIPIRKGVLFHDDDAFERIGGKGRELTAADFVYSFKRLADPKTMSPGWWILDGRLKGLNKWREKAIETGKADYGVDVEGLRALDSHTLELRLTKPQPLIVHLLTLPYASVVAHEAVEHYGPEFMQHPVGTGPFRLQKVLSNQAIWLKNPSYRQRTYPAEGSKEDKALGLLEDAGKPIPFVDKIIDDFVVEDAPAWLNFMQGNHDYLMRIPKDSATAVFGASGKPTRELQDKGIKVLTTPAMEFTYICFNMEDPVVGGKKNRYLREAMALAYDEAPTIERFYLGLATKAQSPIVPGVPGYDPHYKNPSRQYNLVKARQLLAKAGHANGKGLPELVYETTSGLGRRQLAEYFQRSMAELGLRVRIDTLTWPELIGRIRKKQAQLWDISWIYDYPDAENAWQLLVSRNESPGPNASNYKNPRFDALFDRMARLPDGPARRKLFTGMQKIFSDDVPWVIGVYKADTRLVHPWVHNFKIHAFDYNVEKYLRIDHESRGQLTR